LIIKDINDLKKGRVQLSVEEIKQLIGTEIVVQRKGDKFIFYTKKEWSQFTKKALKGLRGQLLHRATRVLFGISSATVNISKQGGVFIPKNLRKN